jgi:hypothetical protein
MEDTGIGSPNTVKANLDRLKKAGLLEVLEDGGPAGVSRYRLMGGFSTRAEGIPDPSFSKTDTPAPARPGADPPINSLSKTVAPFSKTVVALKESDDDLYLESKRLSSSDLNAGSETVAPFSKTVVASQPLPPELERLDLPEIVAADWQTWLVAFGAERVIEAARWYHCAREGGIARSGGLLRSFLEDQRTQAPAGYDAWDYLTVEEQQAADPERLERDQLRQLDRAELRASIMGLDESPSPGEAAGKYEPVHTSPHQDAIRPWRRASESKPSPVAKPSPEQVWKTTLGELQLQMPRETFDTWLRSSVLFEFDETTSPVTYTIGVANVYAREWLEHRLKKVVLRTLGQVARAAVEVGFVVVEREPLQRPA